VDPVAFDAAGAALAWLDTELDNLVAETMTAADSGPRQFCWQLADSLRGYFWLRRPASHWLTTAGAGLAAARRAADQEAEAAMANLLGTAHWALGNHQEAVIAYQEALQVNRRGSRQAGEAGVLGNLAGVYREMGRLRESEQCGRQALALQRAIGNTRGVANALLNLAGLAVDTGQPQQALDLAREALAAYQKLDIPDAIGAALLQAGEAHLALHQVVQANMLLRQAADIFAGIEAAAGQANALILLAQVEYQRGRTESGLAYAARAVELADGIDNAQLESGAATASGNGHTRHGDLTAARRWYQTALDLARLGQTPHCAIDALLGLAEVDGHLDAHDAAVRLTREAVALARAAGLRQHEARALGLLATLTGTVAR
jgi:tetratricopeptide (TPR) repeat protein